MLIPNLTNFSSEPFQMEAFLSKNVDPKIVSKSEDFTKAQKIQLGRHVSQLMKGSKDDFSALGSEVLNPSRDDYHIELAATYIKVAQNRRVEIVKQGLSEALKSLPEEDPLRIALLASLEKLNNLVEASQAEIKKAIDEGLSGLLELETGERKRRTEKENGGRTPAETRAGAIFKALISHGVVTHSDIEKAKGLTVETQKNTIARLFDVHVIPDSAKEGYSIDGRMYPQDQLKTIFEANNTEKRALLETHLIFKDTAKILSQAKLDPRMQIAVLEIRQNLESWDDLRLKEDQEGVMVLKHTISKQLEDLVKLSNSIAKEPTASENSQDQKLSDKSKSTSLPYLNNSIPARAKLQKAVREGKAWAASQSWLKPHRTEKNFVFALQNSDDRRTAAYFKQGNGKTGAQKTSAGYMERIMYDISEILGLADRFVPTGQTTLHTAPSPNTITSPTMVWRDGELQKIEGAQTELSGGIQVAIPGNTLDKEMRLDTVDQISLEEVAHSVLVSIIFGMFDAHAKNVLVLTEGEVETNDGKMLHVVFQNDDLVVSKDGEIVSKSDIKNTVSTKKKILFFDNTRCLPHSNGFIDRKLVVRSSYRCALLCLDQAHRPLDSQTIADLKTSVKECKKNIQNLEKYINSPFSGFQGRLKKVLPGWMNIKESIGAMKQRVDLLEQALATAGDDFTLCELAERANPNYRFAYVLTLLRNAVDNLDEYSFESLVKRYHGHVGQLNVIKEITELAERGFDFQLIKGWCDDTTMSLKDVMKNLVNHEGNNVYGIGKEEKQARIKKGEIIAKEILDNAAVDYKDRMESVAWLNEASLSKLSVIFYNPYKNVGLDENIGILIAERINKGISKIQLLQINKDKYIAIYNTPIGPCSTEVDLGTLDKVKIDDRELSFDDFVCEYSAKKTVTYSELLKLTQEATEEILENVPSGTLIFRKRHGGKSLVVGIQIETPSVKDTHQYHYRFALIPESEEKFAAIFPKGVFSETKGFTIEEIQEEIQKEVQKLSTSAP